jgi:HYPK UBA domain
VSAKDVKFVANEFNLTAKLSELRLRESGGDLKKTLQVLLQLPAER